MAYSFDGALGLSTGSLRWYPRKPGTLTEVHAALGIPATGTGGLTVRLRKNAATTLGSVLVPSGSNVGSFVPSPATYVLGDFFTIDITTVGGTTPGSDLVVQVVGTFNG